MIKEECCSHDVNNSNIYVKAMSLIMAIMLIMPLLMVAVSFNTEARAPGGSCLCSACGCNYCIVECDHSCPCGNDCYSHCFGLCSDLACPWNHCSCNTCPCGSCGCGGWGYQSIGQDNQTYEYSTIDIGPNTLNLKSNGNWVTTYIELPPAYDINDINLSSVIMLIPCDPIEGCEVYEYINIATKPITIGDYDSDGIPDLMVKFDRSALIACLNVGEVELTVVGQIGETGFTFFYGYDTINVI